MALDDGADKFRDNWVPVPLILNHYDGSTKTYTIEFYAPKQLLLNQQWEAMVHDELLRNADRRGLIVEGQISITTEDVAPTVVEEIKEPDVEAEQDAVYKMSDAEKAMRARVRQNIHDRAHESLDVAKRTLEGKTLPTGEPFKINEKEFMKGFLGDALEHPTPEHRAGAAQPDNIKVRAEAFISIDLGEPSGDEEIIEHLPPDIEIPDDLSGLDGA